jgi:hypothetical protein
VTLWSSKAEYVAISEAVIEIHFIYYLLESIGITIEHPIAVRCDNVGAIFMAENSSCGVRTRHIDTSTQHTNLKGNMLKMALL